MRKGLFPPHLYAEQKCLIIGTLKCHNRSKEECKSADHFPLFFFQFLLERNGSRFSGLENVRLHSTGLKSSYASVEGWRVKNKWTKRDGQQTLSVRKLAACSVLNCLICWQQRLGKQCQICTEGCCAHRQNPVSYHPIVLHWAPVVYWWWRWSHVLGMLSSNRSPYTRPLFVAWTIIFSRTLFKHTWFAKRNCFSFEVAFSVVLEEQSSFIHWKEKNLIRKQVV